ncbi:unnamed protein product [Prunus armeniaca]
MPSFLNKFFPSVLRKEAGRPPKNIYCVYDSQVLTSFTSSLYIAGLAASLVASRLARIVGRRNVMVLGGCTFFAGSAINGGAVNIAMLILGRILLGFGVGFTNQYQSTSQRSHHPSGAAYSAQASSSASESGWWPPTA